MIRLINYSLFTIHYSLLAKLVSGGMLALLTLSVAPVVAAASQESPLIVDADQIIYDEATRIMEATGSVRLRYRGLRLSADHAIFDLQRERLTAQGRVVLIDAQGRELRGDRLIYDVRSEQAEITDAETIIDRVYIRSERVQTQQRNILTGVSTFTTCNPERPAYRVTASSVEVTPGERLVARRASLWLGSLRVLTLPVLVLSLRSPEETARGLPRIGYNNVDGFWIDYRYGYNFGVLPGALITKYGTRSGLITRNMLTYSGREYGVVFTVGRNQDKDLRVFDQAELLLALSDRQIGSLPLSFSSSVSEGWFRETVSGVQTSRFQYSVGLRTPAIPLTHATSWQTSISWQDASYGTGARQGVLRVNSAITHRLSPFNSLSLSYGLVEVSGVTPFAFDAIPIDDRINKLSLQYSQVGVRAREIATAFGAGVSYSFRDQTVSVNSAYGERLTDRFHWGLGAEYNLGTLVFKLNTDSGLALGHGTYFTVQAIYNASARSFEDLDYIITVRLCDCFDLSLKYRQVRQEIFLEVGLAAAPGTRLQFQFPRP